MTATLLVNADMGNYSSFLGSAQMLPNGNLTFTSGGLLQGRSGAGQSIEVLPNGTRIFVQLMSLFEYRSYFESTLYSASIHSSASVQGGVAPVRTPVGSQVTGIRKGSTVVGPD
jgi:hypothetical protein